MAYLSGAWMSMAYAVLLNHAHLLKSQFLAHLLYFLSTELCPTLTTPNSGKVKWNGTRPNSIAEYSCKSGYSLSGQATRTCLSTGEWSGSAPVCESKCPSLHAYGYMLAR